MAIYRGSGGSVEGITEADIVTIAISQGGTGATTASGARSNLGLGTAATTDASAYATAAQGTLADSAVQPGDLGAVATSNSYNDLDDTPSLATVATSGSYNDLSDKPTVPTNLDSLTDVVITSATTSQILQYDGTNWVNASVGGSGTVTSVAMSVPTGLSVSGSPITSSGTLAVTFTSGYAIPTTAKQTEWDTAYGWGNHASAGYATYPTQTGNSGKYLTTNGSTTSWATVDTLPSQTGNSGKYLTTDGTSASWASVATLLNVLNRAGSTISVALSNGVLPVLNRAGSTINVAVS